MNFAKIIGTGGYLPSKIVSNGDLAKIVDTSDEWIQTRTGIKQRHFAADDEHTSDMATAAAKEALQAAGLAPSDIDGIIVATCTPDIIFPSTAALVQNKLGITGSVAAFDVQAACSGFVQALATADGLIRAGTLNNVLVIGAEKLSRLLDFSDRNICVLFGDGAGAVVLSRSDADPKQGASGVLASKLYNKPDTTSILYATYDAKGDNEKFALHMNGKEVFRVAVTELAQAMLNILEQNNLSSAQLDWLVPHQANKRILTSLAQKLKISEEKVIMTVDRHANTSAASVPMALDEAVRDGRVKKGDLCLLEAIGGGMAIASSLVRF